MADGIAGRYYSNTFTSTAGGDLITQFQTESGADFVNIKKMTLITLVDVGIDINSTGVYSHLFLDTDNLYKLSLDSRDVIINSVLIEDADVEIFLAGVF